MSGTRNASRVAPRDSDSAILKQYYRDNVLYMSAEGVLKVLSVILCLVSAVLQLTSTRCAGAPRLASAAALVALLSAAALSFLFSGSALSITNYAPTSWLFIDIILSSVIGVTLLVTAVLGMVLCEMDRALDYVQGPLTILNAAIATASGVVTYVSVTKRWDAAQRSRQLHQPPTSEQDV